MPEPRFTPEDIIDLAEQLRRARFNIGLQQYVAAEDLMIALLTQNRLPEDPRKWKSLLGPIFCSSPMEQEQFPQVFDAWLSRKPRLLKQIKEAKQAELADAPPSVESALPKQPLTIADVLGWIRRHPAWSAAIALTLAALLMAGLMLKIDHELTGQVFSQSDGKELPGAEVSFLGQKTTTDANGKFSIGYQIRGYEWIASTRVEQFAVAHIRHYQQTGMALLKNPPKPSITLQVRPDNLPIVPIPIPVPTSETQTEQKETPTVERPNYWRPVLAALIPLLALALFLLVRWIRRRMMLRRLETSGSPQLHKVTFKREDAPMFVSSPFRRAAQELRRHRLISHHDLNVTATVNATIQKGVFTPTYSARRAAPEYLLLIDRASVDDSQARLADELARRLAADKVYVDQFYFQEDARTLREPKPLSPVITLHELASRYPDHRLLVFSDAVGFFNPFTGEPGHWLEQFDYWEQRILLTPESPAAWGYREFTLAEQYGFTLIPAKTEGLAALANLLNFDLSPDYETDHTPQFPELIARDTERWLDSREPKPEVIEKLCGQLKTYLGEDGWLWLAACAVYPQIKWEITLYLGGRLAGEFQYPAREQGGEASKPLLTRGLPTRGMTTQDKDWAERVLRLVRLPWFRFGRMPDWMRDRLIASFTAEQDRSIRRIVTDLLSHVTKDITQPLMLDFAEPEPLQEKWKAFKQRISERYKQWRQHRQFYRLFQVQDADSPLRDFVFLSFLAGHSRKRLGVNPPDLLRRILFNEGVAALGVRAVTAGVAAMAMAGIVMLALWPKLPEPILLAENNPPPTVTPVTPTPATSRTPKPPEPILSAGNDPPPTVMPEGSVAPTPATSGATEPTPPGNQSPKPTPTGMPVDPVGPKQTTRVAGQSFTISQTPNGSILNVSNNVTLELVIVPDGVFMMGSNNGDKDQQPEHQVFVPKFEISRSEVTNRLYKVFVNSTRHAPPQGLGYGWQANLYPAGHDDLPVVFVSWDDAVAFCIWLSKETGHKYRLPTESEWEKAARTVSVNYSSTGSVWEWCSDWYDSEYYKLRDRINPQGPIVGKKVKRMGFEGMAKSLRGGGFGRGQVMLRAAERNFYFPNKSRFDIGFRIIREIGNNSGK